MADTYMQYEDEDTGIVARWHGGEYIDLGYIDQMSGGEFVATDCINVWDHAEDARTIPFTCAALAACVEEHLNPEDDDEEEDDDDDDVVDVDAEPIEED